MNSPEMREWVEGANAALREAAMAVEEANNNLIRVRERHRAVAVTAWVEEGQVWLAAQRAERPVEPGEVEQVEYAYDGGTNRPTSRWLARIESRTQSGSLRLVGNSAHLGKAGAVERQETISSNLREYKRWCERFGVSPNPRRG